MSDKSRETSFAIVSWFRKRDKKKRYSVIETEETETAFPPGKEGWNSEKNPVLKLIKEFEFETKDEALLFAESSGIEIDELPSPDNVEYTVKSNLENFVWWAYKRIVFWT